jgi:formylglycine-generating enzyme required for sulfatase activity
MVRSDSTTVSIAGGWFLMGSEDGAENERPIHRVWVDPFALGRFQVTNAEYATFLKASGHPEPPCWTDPALSDPNQPVVAVTWNDAASYCGWLGRVTDRRYRLPTEAEWEFAARGGAEGRRYPWGDAELDRHRRGGPAAGPDPVGRSTPNAYGLYDMCENVHEWCSDWFAADYYARSPARNPGGPQSGSRRVSRGGSWRHQIRFSRCAARSSIPPGLQYADYGFRIAGDAPDAFRDPDHAPENSS